MMDDNTKATLRAERDALQRFKEFVHRRLDEAGIPTHPDGPHSKEGCRIGDRLDIALQFRSLALEDLVAFEQIEQLCESGQRNTEEIAQHARDGIRAIHAAFDKGSTPAAVSEGK